MKKLNVYGGTYDGKNRVIVASPTKKAAYNAMKSAGLFNGGYGSWDAFTSDSGNETEVAVATPYPLTVFTRDNRDRLSDFSAVHKRDDAP